MATKLFVNTTNSDYGTGNNDARLAGSTGGWVARLLDTIAGTSATNFTTNTVAGATAGIEVNLNGVTGPQVWYSRPLAAAVTISGSITWNIWAAESSASANVAINGRLEKIDGATGAITLIDATARVTEVALTTRAVNNFAETPAAGVACKKGDRLRLRIYGDDAGTMGTGFTFSTSFNGPTAAADGDTWIQLTEDLTFAAEPAGTQVFPTDTASDVSTASNDKEAWTSRGGGVATVIVNTVTGFTAPIQWTDSAGGTVVDWFTRPLTAFTLGGAVRCNIRALESNVAANAAVAIEISRVANDGTSPTVWAKSTFPTELATSEVARSFLVSGDDIAVTAGQRLRIRLLIDDPGPADVVMASGQTVTLFYAGAAAATGDTYLTFTQTLTEFVAPPGPHVSPYPQILGH